MWRPNTSTLEFENEYAALQCTVTQSETTGNLKHKSVQESVDAAIGATPEQQMISLSTDVLTQLPQMFLRKAP